MKRRGLLAYIVLALALAGTTAHARGHLQSRQTGIDIAAGTRAGRLVLANSGDAPVAAQVRVYAWTQVDGEDRLEPSNALIPSPPIIEIPAGAEQLVRLVRPTAAAPAQEQAYRVVVDELPGNPGEGDGAAVTVRMRYLIPAFVRSADPAPVQLHCRVEPATAQATLRCENTGGRAARLGATTLLGQNGQAVELTDGLYGYVLAHSVRHWPLPAEALVAIGTPTALKSQVNGQPLQVRLGPQPPVR